MFDTSIVRSRAVAAPSRYGLLTASVALHSALVVAGISAGLAATSFPTHAPDQIAMFRPIEVPVIPPPLGRPDAPKREPQAVPETPKHQVTTTPAVVAPEVIPSEAPSVASTAGTGAQTGSQAGTAGPGHGDPNGMPGGLGEVAPQPEPEITYTPGGDVRAAQVLRRVEPRYPTAMLGVRLREVTVTVRGVIGKDGRIRDAQVLRSSFTPFNDSVLEAVHQWTFAPGTRRGEPVDTYFELTVRFMVR